MSLFLGLYVLTIVTLEGRCGCVPDLQDLRKFTNTGYGGEFEAAEQDLQRVIDERVSESELPTANINLQNKDQPRFSVYLSNVKDITLQESGYEPSDYQEVVLALPVTVGVTNGDLQLAHFTNSHDTLNPYLVDYKRVIIVDELNIIEKDNEVTWSLKKDSGELEIKVVESNQQDSSFFFKKRNEDDEFKIKTDFPHVLDWGCDKMDTKAPFCTVLDQKHPEIMEAGQHISNINKVSPSSTDVEDYKTYDMQIKKLTGFFNEKLPFIVVNQSATFTFKGTVEETVGIVYHCITE